MLESPEAVIVTLSRHPDIFEQFRRAAEKHEPDARKILVRDGREIESPPGWLTINGPEPFCFARNANLGIKQAQEFDVVLANDDAELLESKTLERLARVAYSDPKIGAVSPLIAGAAMNPMQRAGHRFSPDPYICEEKFYAVAFVFVYLKRSALNMVGLLDEGFEDAAFEDNDWCLRARKAGLQIAITSSVTVFHGFEGGEGSTSIKRKWGNYRPLIEKNRPRFLDKWKTDKGVL